MVSKIRFPKNGIFNIISSIIKLHFAALRPRDCHKLWKLSKISLCWMWNTFYRRNNFWRYKCVGWGVKSCFNAFSNLILRWITIRGWNFCADQELMSWADYRCEKRVRAVLGSKTLLACCQYILGLLHFCTRSGWWHQIGKHVSFIN